MILWVSAANSYLERAAATVCSLLGSEAEALDKRDSTITKSDRSLVCLGWIFLLNNWTVDVAQDNRLKALYHFWIINLDQPVDMETTEALCSLAERYSLVYRKLGVLMGGLYRMLGGLHRVGRKAKRC